MLKRHGAKHVHLRLGQRVRVRGHTHRRGHIGIWERRKEITVHVGNCTTEIGSVGGMQRNWVKALKVEGHDVRLRSLLRVDRRLRVKNSMAILDGYRTHYRAVVDVCNDEQVY